MIARQRRITAHARRRVDPTLIVVCLAIAATQGAWAVVVPVLPVYVEQFGASALDLGLVVALFGAGRLIANIPAGFLARRWDPRKLLVTSVLGVVSGLVGTAFATSYGALLILRLLTGIAGGIAITSGMTLVGMLATASERGRAMSLLQAIQIVGSSGGAMLGGLAFTLGGVRAPFLVSGVVAVLVVVFGSPALFRRPRPTVASLPNGQVASPLAALTGRSFIAVCLAGAAVFFHRFGGMQSLLPLAAYSVFGLSVGEYGVLQGSVAALGFFAAVPAGMWSDQVGRKAIIVPGLVVGGAGLPFLLGSGETWVFVVVMAATTLAVSMSGPVQSAYIADLVPPAALGPAVGIFRSSGDLAGIVGPLILGALADRAGLEVALLGLACALLAAGLLFAFGAKETVGRKAAPHGTL